MPEEPDNLQFEGDNLTFEGEVITFQGSSEEPTFGLPASSVALIEQNFGTVANFLRLRRQGQI